MEFTIRKIISIDKEAENYRSAMEESLNVKHDQFDNYLRSMKELKETECKNEKIRILEESLKEAEEVVASIDLNKQKNIIEINRKFEMAKLELVNKLVREFIYSN